MVELLIAMSIATTLVAGILASYTYLARNLIRYSFEQQLEAESRRALQMITQDVRRCGSL
jgi:Tfp pilus assembly protein PilW